MTGTDGEIFHRLGAVEQALATLTERQSGFTFRMDKRTEEILDHVKETNSRVKHLEIWQNRVIGAVGVILFLFTILGGVAMARLLNEI